VVKFVRNITCNLMIGAFLGMTSATAMDGFVKNQEIADQHMKKGWAAFDQAVHYQKQRVTHRSIYHLSTIDCSLKTAETEFNTALRYGSSYAAYALRYIYIPGNDTQAPKQIRPFWYLKQMFPEQMDSANIFVTCLSFYDQLKKDMYKDVLLKSIQMKNRKSIKTLLDAETELLMTLEGGSFKNMIGLQRVEELNPDKAIACYGYLSSNCDGSESGDAFNALLRLQENPSAWVPIASAHFSRNNIEEGLVWMEKAVVKNIANNSTLGLLENRSKNEDLPIHLRAKAARLAYEHAKIHLKGTETFFFTALTYYKLLKEEESQGVDVSVPVINVGSTLGRIAEDNLRTNPDWLFQFAKLQEAEAQKSKDWVYVLDMYRRAANNQCLKAREALITSPHFLKIGIDEAVIFLVQHHQDEALLNSYDQTNDPLFLVVLSLMTQGGEFVLKAGDLLSRHADSYAPALDLKILQLLKSRNLSKGDDHAKTATIYRPGNGLTSWFLPTDGYIHSGHSFGSKEEAIRFQQKLVDADKKIEQEKQVQIKEIFSKKIEIINALPAKDQFALAQEYRWINQAVKTETFLEGYYLILEKSAEKGYLPAVKELIESYTNKYLQKEGYIPSQKVALYKGKADFYQGIQTILTDKTLDVVEQVELLQKAFNQK